MEQGSEYACDVLVVGSGGSGMSAAITAASRGLKVLVIEKEPKFGGSTARSGGWLWIPNTALAKAQGIFEMPDAARTYHQHEAGERVLIVPVSTHSSNTDPKLSISLQQRLLSSLICRSSFPTITPMHRLACKAGARW